jgi:hypothetical protein
MRLAILLRAAADGLVLQEAFPVGIANEGLILEARVVCICGVRVPNAQCAASEPIE